MTTVAVLGASGMLGSMVLDVLARDENLKLVATVRRMEQVEKGRTILNGVEWRLLDAENNDAGVVRSAISDAAWIVNAAGVIKPCIHDDNPAEVERAIKVNALFPCTLAKAAAMTGGKVIQIATDCAYSGIKGHYVETDPHDPQDVYGKTKSLGEVHLPDIHHLRCSIIGPEPKGYLSLFEWFRRQQKGAKVNGYTNHQWNGVTTYHFARLCGGIIEKGMELPHLQHVIPAGAVSKAELLRCFAREYHREDITITQTEAKTVIDRTLATTSDKVNRALWTASGYSAPPTITQMVAELAKHDYRFEGVWH